MTSFATTSSGAPSIPSDDLMTQLLNAEFEDEDGDASHADPPGGLTYTAVLAGAGNETTGRLIGWLAKVLAEHPDQRQAVVADRSLVPSVIEETLRYEPTGHATARYVMEDVDYYGITVPAGSAILTDHGFGQSRPSSLRATPTSSTSTARTASTSPSGTAPTSASVRASPASKVESRSTRS